MTPEQIHHASVLLCSRKALKRIFIDNPVVEFESAYMALIGPDVDETINHTGRAYVPPYILRAAAAYAIDEIDDELGQLGVQEAAA